MVTCTYGNVPHGNVDMVYNYIRADYNAHMVTCAYDNVPMSRGDVYMDMCIW